MKKSSKIIPITLALLLGSGAAIASGGHHGHGNGHGGMRHGHGHGYEHGHRQGGMRHGLSLQHMIKKMDRHFDLTQEQQTALENLVEQNRDKMRANRMANHELRNQALTLDPTAADYDTRVNDMVSQVSSLAGEQALMAANMYREVAGILTPQQLDEMQTMMSKRQQKIGRRMEHRKEHKKEQS